MKLLIDWLKKILRDNKNIEIERKFLLTNKEVDMFFNINKFNLSKREEIIQFYIDENPEMRARKVKGEFKTKYYFTIKSKGNMCREEYEIEVSQKFYNMLLSKRIYERIIKTRFTFNIGRGQKVELDMYKDMDLNIVEVEFKSKRKANKFKAPDYFGKEVTDDTRYKNMSLAKNGLSKD